MQEVDRSEVPRSERWKLAIPGCWWKNSTRGVECAMVATVRDGAGWFWCEEHARKYAQMLGSEAISRSWIIRRIEEALRDQG